MADENSISEKEVESAKVEEKEEDTTNVAKESDRLTPGNDGPVKSRTPSASSKRSASPGKTPPTPAKAKPADKGGAKGGKGGKAGAKAAKPKKEEVDDKPAAEEKGPADDIVPLFLASKTQELFGCVADVDVTEENPHKFLPKEGILQDMRNRAAVSDFHPVKQRMLDYPGEEILVVFDPDFRMGQNFYIALTEEAKQHILNPPPEDGEEGAEQVDGEGGVGAEEEVVVYRYVPPEPKEWVSLGSEVEIEDEMVTESRAKIKMTIQRVRREFGAPVTFTDRNADDVKDGYIECSSYEDKSYNVKKVEMDYGIQAVPTYSENGTQTDWKHPRNQATQYFPREFDNEEKKTLMEMEELLNTLNQVTPRFELSLQQNEIMNVFNDDWLALADEDSTFGSKSDSHLKEYQSFTDLQFSKDKAITCIEWHPTIKGIIAVSCSERMSFDDRVDNASKIIMNPSLILLWSFTDPIHPQILLEAPDDIFSFKFCPSDPNIIAGGCINGQVVMWDISKHADRLRSNQRGKQTKKNSMMKLPGFEDENTDQMPIVRYCAVSGIEHSHKMAISELQWVPDHMEITRMGIVVENKTGTCSQILSASTDGCIAIWDTKPPKGHTPSVEDAKQKDNPLAVSTTFKHLDLTWKPTLKFPVSKIEGNGEYGVLKVSIQERQGDRSVLEKQGGKGSEVNMGASMGMGSSLRTGSAKDKKPLEGVTSKFFVGTEAGELVYADWKLEKDADSGKIQPPRPQFAKLYHDWGINTLQRSPFFKDLVLAVGGWNFTLWKEGIEGGPIIQSATAPKKLTAGYWSPTRPAVFFVGRSDGNIDIWDLLDKTHEPSLSQNVSASTITQIYPWVVNSKQQLLAVSDSVGTLHILEVPWSLRHATIGELPSMTSYIEREVKRLEFIDKRQDFHIQNKRRLDAEEAQQKMAQPAEPSTEEVENKMRVGYLDYLEEEKKFLEALGLSTQPEEPLPEV
ncbi:WD repeat-containing protein 63-like isoform X2 [Acanthaster planci]|uniref:WD repeat-containing protein 63-like isoform X2 n=1 Tax=Acanthaster planci TaxID=133434 RepID=A0A8B7Y406_ACAPL|nr:WD repeat-containing protein 63-like isoform X2 [Acanthaster planci]